MGRKERSSELGEQKWSDLLRIMHVYDFKQLLPKLLGRDCHNGQFIEWYESYSERFRGWAPRATRGALAGSVMVRWGMPAAWWSRARARVRELGAAWGDEGLVGEGGDEAVAGLG